MDRMKRIAGMARGASTVPVRTKDEDESLVLFGELNRNGQEKDVNLLDPMYSVEFEAIHGDGHMFKLPSGKRDYLLPDGEKHDYDWLKTPPATPLFRSLEMEADSSQMVFQKELPLLQPVKTSRFSKKPEAVSMSTMSESPTTSSSSKSATPTARPSSSSKKNLTTTTTTRGSSPAVSEHENSVYRIDKRSSYTPLANRQPSAVPAARKTSGKKQPTVPGSTNAAKNIAVAKPPPPKNIAAAAPRDRSKGPAVSAKDLKVDGGNGGAARRVSRPPAATTGTGNGELNAVTARGRAELAARGRGRACGEPVAGNGAAHVAAEAVVKGRRRGVGEKEQMQRKLGSHAKKLAG